MDAHDTVLIEYLTPGRGSIRFSKISRSEIYRIYAHIYFSLSLYGLDPKIGLQQLLFTLLYYPLSFSFVHANLVLDVLLTVWTYSNLGDLIRDPLLPHFLLGLINPLCTAYPFVPSFYYTVPFCSVHSDIIPRTSLFRPSGLRASTTTRFE